MNEIDWLTRALTPATAQQFEDMDVDAEVEAMDMEMQMQQEPKQTRTFPLRVVLTVTTGRLLTEPRGPQDNGISDLYEILNWITGDELFTHQLPRAERAAMPWLLKCFPELVPACASLDSLDRWLNSDQTGGQEAIKMWLTELRMMFPEIKDSYEVAPMPEGWTHIDAMIELETMVSDPSKIIKIEVRNEP